MGQDKWVVPIGIHDIGFTKKPFEPFILLEIKVRPLNGTNFVVGKNLVSFCDGQDKSILFIGIHDIEALVL